MGKKNHNKQKRRQQGKKIEDITTQIDINSYLNCIMIDPEILFITPSPYPQEIKILIFNYSDNDFNISFSNKDIGLECNNEIVQNDKCTIIEKEIICSSISNKEVNLPIVVKFISVSNKKLEFNKIFNIKIKEKEEEIKEIIDNNNTEQKIKQKENKINISIKNEEVIVIGKEIPIKIEIDNQEDIAIRIKIEEDKNQIFTLKTKKEEEIIKEKTKKIMKESFILFNKYSEGPFNIIFKIIKENTGEYIGNKKVYFESIIIYPEEETIKEEKKKEKGKIEDFQITIMNCSQNKNEKEVMIFIGNYTKEKVLVKYKEQENIKGIKIKGSFKQEMKSGEESYIIFGVIINRKEINTTIGFLFEIETNKIIEEREIKYQIQKEIDKKKEIEFPKLNNIERIETIKENKKIDSNYLIKKQKKKLEKECCLKECNWYNLSKDLNKEEKIIWIIIMIEHIKEYKGININIFNIIINENMEFTMKQIKRNERKLEEQIDQMTSFFMKPEKEIKEEEEEEIFAIGTTLLCGLIGKIPDIPYWIWDEHLEKKEEPIKIEELIIEEKYQKIGELCIQCWKGLIKYKEIQTKLKEYIKTIKINEIIEGIKKKAKEYQEKEIKRIQEAQNIFEEFNRKYPMINSLNSNDKTIITIKKFEQPIQRIQKQNNPIILQKYEKQEIAPFKEGDRIQSKNHELKKIIEETKDFILKECHGKDIKQVRFYNRKTNKISQPPFYQKPSNILITFKIDNNVFGLYINDKAKLNKSAFILTKDNYKLLSIQNQYNTQPFVFTMIKSETKLQFFGISHENLMELNNIFLITKKDYKMIIYETLINQRITCGLHKPSEYISTNINPISSIKKFIDEIIYYDIII
ncbi:DNA double-strand break repair Rad50 ATPase, putative [Entamoeba dispar SAW760]|uniref:DNA double-strand break repair Rad50 ATPase, putative n=1 Tax=Entamoeba dispar (strain ATCC PRA-260 / SAW760) TaxID=370354 RepID=B0E891_ENTDS|nr:DNA double-strand break repair Rad50 ATPase, putative [Entamoeba dispar SAW760]EDR29216.1 DNA double-strand break repair Rad50 ATPase, putative [Entamoeba dispar SAW760]|eukprot:EDR29216.1 DNA double-strand break repair Rad50 ATPase, putative [Entamoeba dispar SAW760]